jgi:chorismate-pyruvate lyase
LGILIGANGTQANASQTVRCGLLTRMLLACDGTLTLLLEAAFSEPVSLVVHSQMTTHADQSTKSLHLDDKQRVMKRAVILRGATTRRHFVYAESSIAIDRLPHSFAVALESRQTTIGELWRSHRLLIRRTTLGMQLKTCPALVGVFEHAPSLMVRRYLVIAEERPIMTISEYFPLHYGLSHDRV